MLRRSPIVLPSGRDDSGRVRFDCLISSEFAKVSIESRCGRRSLFNPVVYLSAAFAGPSSASPTSTWRSARPLGLRVRAIVDRTFPLTQAAEAHAFLESGQHTGNVVLVV